LCITVKTTLLDVTAIRWCIACFLCRTDNYERRRATLPDDESGWHKDRHFLHRSSHTLSNDRSTAAESNFRVQKQTGKR